MARHYIRLRQIGLACRQKLAGSEKITIEEIGGTVYAFGSELACLRLEHGMRVGRSEYSKNLQTWTYSVGRE